MKKAIDFLSLCVVVPFYYPMFFIGCVCSRLAAYFVFGWKYKS